MRYRALLIDADDTIFDFGAAEKRAIAEVISFAGVTNPDAPDVYSEINKSYWRKLERGEVTTAFLRVARFRDFADRYNVSIDAQTLADEFVRALSRQHDLIPGALETLEIIAGHMSIAIVTNGIPEVQHARFDASPIMRFVSHLVISGEVGSQKPDPRIVHEALSCLGGVAPKDALLVGDGLLSDILAANRAGVDACWYNPKSLARPEGAKIEYEIKDIRELAGIALAE
jgi:2-haloacid dehalogenase